MAAPFFFIEQPTSAFGQKQTFKETKEAKEMLLVQHRIYVYIIYFK